jgi:drug/metabolite transporter (DMT)-like permease
MKNINVDDLNSLVRNNKIGILSMILKGLVFSLITILISKLSKSIHTFEIFFLTMIVRLICLFPFLISKKYRSFNINNAKFYFIRAALTSLSLFSWFFVLKISKNVIDVTAISFITPLFTVIAGWFFTKEQLNAKMIQGLLVGFIGVLIIIRPGFAEIGKAEILALCTAIIWAFTDVVVKIQSRSEGLYNQTFINTALMILFSAPLALMVWKQPNIEQIYYIIITGVLFLINNLTLTLSYKYADFIIVAPFSFTRLIFTSLFAFIFFNEVINGWEICGTIIIAISNIYIIYVERAYNKQFK